MNTLGWMGWSCAVVFFAFWVIEHVGGREKRDDLRHQLGLALDVVGLVMRGKPVHPGASERLDAKVVDLAEWRAR